MTYGIAYNQMSEVIMGSRHKCGAQYSIHIIIPCSGSLIIQLNNAHMRDQWFHSLVWKMTASRFLALFVKINNPEELTRDLKELVSFCLRTPITDPDVHQLPLSTMSTLLTNHGNDLNDELRTEIIKVIAPILETSSLTPLICDSFHKMIKDHPKVEIQESFLPPVQRVMKHNTDFGKFPHLRIFIQDYLLYTYAQKADGINAFIQGLHTATTTCPHPRVLPNLVTVSLAAIYSVYEDEAEQLTDTEKRSIVECFKQVFRSICKFYDWLPYLSVLLQAVPFPCEALKDSHFSSFLADIIVLFAQDKRCEVHQSILPIREEKDGWIHHFAPGGVCCNDNGELFSQLMSHLIPCCCKRKKMLVNLKNNMRALFTLMAIRGDKNCIETLIALLDFNLIDSEDERLVIIAALQSSEEGRRQYDELSSKRNEFVKMKQSGGPQKLTLPSQSTDEDLIHVLKSGSFGNLRSLNLAFTRVTSEAAKYIIRLPSLLHLNLWATPFDDKGLQLITEHLSNLQSLNLCETCVTDEGLSALMFLENLRILNLNSTGLSALTYECLKEKLRDLQVVDLRYTEAW